MAYWSTKQQRIVRFPDQDVPIYPGWEIVDCGCCSGLQWGGDSPTECKDCGGSGVKFRHKASGALAEYPGGPFCGREIAASKGGA